MPYYAVRVVFDFDLDDGDRHYTDRRIRTAALYAYDAESACESARIAFKPMGGCWSASECEAVECADEDSATYIAREMERWDWGCSR